jgi:DNA-binding transcriptional LysR family regulator
MKNIKSETLIFSGNKQLPFRREFLAFFETAQKGSILKASEALGIQQAGLSKLIMRLESDMSQKLFTRSQRGVQLTAHGQVLFDSLKSTLQYWENHIRAQSQEQLQKVQLLKVGAHSAVSSYLYPLFLNTLVTANPSLQLETMTATSLEVTRLVADLKLDLGFVVNPIRNTDLVMKILGNDHVFCWSKSHQPEAVIYYNPDMFQGSHLLKKFKKSRLIPVRDYETIATLVSGGKSSGLLPTSIANKHHLTAVSEKLLSVQLAVIWHKDKSKLKPFQEMMNLILKEIKL